MRRERLDRSGCTLKEVIQTAHPPQRWWPVSSALASESAQMTPQIQFASSSLSSPSVRCRLQGQSQILSLFHLRRILISSRGTPRKRLHSRWGLSRPIHPIRQTTHASVVRPSGLSFKSIRPCRLGWHNLLAALAVRGHREGHDATSSPKETNVFESKQKPRRGLDTHRRFRKVSSRPQKFQTPNPKPGLQQKEPLKRT